MDILWLYELPFWLDGVLFFVVLILAVEGGFRIGIRQHRATADAKRTVRGDVTLGSMLALLGLMLAFTYAFSLSRADMRKQAVVNEANAIGTAFLRADLGADPGRNALRGQLLEYARTRLVSEELFGEELQDAIDRSLEAQSKLWPMAKRTIQGDVPGPIQASIVQAVNDVLDAHTTRIAVVSDRIPAAVFVLLVLIAAASLAVAAHNAGLNGTMNRWRMGAFSLVLAALMVVIVDFDRGRRGFIQLSNQPLEAVIRDMETSLRD